MDKSKNNQRQNGHPYRPNTNGTNNRFSNQQANFRRNLNKFEIESDSSGKVYIHPNSMYNESFPKFQQPVEIGIIVSESNTFLIINFHSKVSCLKFCIQII